MHALYNLLQVARQIRVGPVDGHGPAYQDIINACAGVGPQNFLGKCAEAAAGAIALYRVANFFGCGEADPRRRCLAFRLAALVGLQHKTGSRGV
jgi:hypothetical protein